MIIKPLLHSSIAELADVFNKSFAGYYVPLQLTEEQLQNKIVADSIDLSLSVGAFEEGKLIGFILHGIACIDDKKIAYNAGTGVIPAQRGKKITAKLYAFIVPLLKEQGVVEVVLEVITANSPAIKIYENSGFKKTKELNCFKGFPVVSKLSDEWKATEIKNVNRDWPQSFWDWAPSWQNSFTAVEMQCKSIDFFGTFKEDELVAYIIFNRITGRVLQFATHKNYRRRGYATALFSKAFHVVGKELSVINVDNSAETTKDFLSSMGLQSYIRQHEMKLSL